MSDFDELVKQANELVKKKPKSERRKRQQREWAAKNRNSKKKNLHLKPVLKQIIASTEDKSTLTEARIIRKVLAKEGFDSPGLDVLDDEELITLVKTGSSVKLAIYRYFREELNLNSEVA